jgi:hypothetical protein
MATRTKPLITAAALASAAAVAVASPAIAPNLTPTPAALSAAQVELTTFSDLLSITPADWVNYAFIGWGGAIGPINIDPQTTESDYWAPQCDYNCLKPGLPGLLYLGLDALINGTGAGIANVSGVPNPSYTPKFPEGPGNYKYLQPGQPGYVAPWGTSAVNYFFEGGLSTGVQYVLQQPFATGAPLANKQIFDGIKLAFQIGSGNLWIAAFTQTLATAAVLANSIPLIGPYLYRGIGSYIGPAFVNIDTLYDYSSYAGIPGVLRYIGGVITTGGNPNPYPTAAPEPAPTAAVAALSSPVAVSKSASRDTGTVTTAVVKPEIAAPKAGETPSADSTPTSGGSAESTSTEAVSEATVSDTKPAETKATDTKATDTKPAVTTPAVDSPSSAVADAASEAPAATKPADTPAKASRQQRPVRSALERATKKIASAIAGPAAKAAPAADGSADSGASAG